MSHPILVASVLVLVHQVCRAQGTGTCTWVASKDSCYVDPDSLNQTEYRSWILANSALETCALADPGDGGCPVEVQSKCNTAKFYDDAKVQICAPPEFSIGNISDTRRIETAYFNCTGDPTALCIPERKAFYEGFTGCEKCANFENKLYVALSHCLYKFKSFSDCEGQPVPGVGNDGEIIAAPGYSDVPVICDWNAKQSSCQSYAAGPQAARYYQVIHDYIRCTQDTRSLFSNLTGCHLGSPHYCDAFFDAPKTVCLPSYSSWTNFEEFNVDLQAFNNCTLESSNQCKGFWTGFFEKLNCPECAVEAQAVTDANPVCGALAEPDCFRSAASSTLSADTLTENGVDQTSAAAVALVAASVLTFFALVTLAVL